MDTDKFANKKLAIIGGGHLGLALVKGLLKSGQITPSQLVVANRSLSKIVHLEKLGIKVTRDNRLAVMSADWIFLAVKSAVIKEVLQEIKDLVGHKLIVSLAAVVTISQMRSYIRGYKLKVVRLMPNVNIAHNQGVIGLLTDKISRKEKVELKELLSGLGLVLEVDSEDNLDSLTLVSACGPALVAYFIELLRESGLKLGLRPDPVDRLVLETFKGTLSYLENSRMTVRQLKESVATKGGLTETILKNLQEKRFESIFIQSIEAGRQRLADLKEKLY